MNVWLLSALGLLLGLVPCGVVLVWERVIEGLVAMQLAGALTAMILLLLAQGLGQPAFIDLALALALLSFPAALLFAPFYAR